MADAAIEFHGVSKAYRRRFRGQFVAALSNFSFAVEQGEVCAFLGPNGAGKTTAISLLMGLLPADSGHIQVLGWPAGDVRARRQIGFLPENFAFYGYLTAPRLLEMHLSLSGHRSAAPDLIPSLLAQVKLQGFEQLRISRYSRGMVQRIGIAQALLADPQLLVLDEPTSGLDPASRRDVLELLSRLKSAGKTVFISSHILPEVEQIADRIIVIDRGRLVRAGRLSELLDPGHRVEILVGDLPADAEQAAIARGASVEHLPSGARLVFDAAHKREMTEMLWVAGCDIISMNPVTSSLQDLFLKLVAEYENAV